jgi:hypothetical protein
MVWFNENYDWIYTWLDTAKPDTYYDEMQIFKTTSLVEKSSLIDRVRQFDYKKDPNVLGCHAQRLEEHKFNILLACVFGVGSKVSGYREGSGVDKASTMPPVRYLQGFIEQTDRYPTKKDKVRIEYLQGNGVKRWLQKHEVLSIPRGDGGINRYMPGQFYLFLSECKLRVL